MKAFSSFSKSYICRLRLCRNVFTYTMLHSFIKSSAWHVLTAINSCLLTSDALYVVIKYTFVRKLFKLVIIYQRPTISSYTKLSIEEPEKHTKNDNKWHSVLCRVVWFDFKVIRLMNSFHFMLTWLNIHIIMKLLILSERVSCFQLTYCGKPLIMRQSKFLLWPRWDLSIYTKHQMCKKL